MSVTLVLEHAPHRQAETRRTVEAGDLVIGRGTDADWVIDDPDMYVSRTHCIVSVTEDGAVVRDASRGGLFVDGASAPLGPGNSVALQDGMRLRLGDFVLKVEMAEGAAAAPRRAGRNGTPFVWAEPAPEAEAPGRPDSLPRPFEERDETPPRPEDRARGDDRFDDPFTLDERDAPRRREPPRGGGYFDTPAPGREPPGPQDAAPKRADADWDWPAKPAAPADGAAEGPGGFSWDLPERPAGQPPEEGFRSSRVVERRAPSCETAKPAAEAAPAERPRRPSAGEDAALRAAFFRGLGVAPPDLPPEEAAAEMEALGARFRQLTEGLVQMLRARAQEKQNVRVAQTIIGSAEVNPLKFAASTEDAVAALVALRGPGYLPPEPAIEGAFRDLADHQLRTWTAVQAALRRMIDRFDPESIEAEIERAGLLETLLAGGRSAKLWQIYCERYREIARSAEERFLGEIGADFRDAYEGRREK